MEANLAPAFVRVLLPLCLTDKVDVALQVGTVRGDGGGGPRKGQGRGSGRDVRIEGWLEDGAVSRHRFSAFVPGQFLDIEGFQVHLSCLPLDALSRNTWCLRFGRRETLVN